MELALAIVQNFNPWLAICVIGICAGIAITKVNRRWADTNDRYALREHERKQYELETERTVKLQRLSEHPASGEKLVEHRSSDKRREYDEG